MPKRWGKHGNGDRFFILSSQITADDDCSHEIKTLAPRKESYDQSWTASWKAETSLCDKSLSSQSYGFSSSHVWMWELDHKEGWAPKNWCLQTVVLEKTLRVPWTAKRSNQSILKEINPEYSLEGLMLKLKLQYFGNLMWRANSLEKTLMLGKLRAEREEGDRGWDGWMASPTRWTWVEQTPDDCEGQGSLECFSPWGCKDFNMTEWLNSNRWLEQLEQNQDFVRTEGKNSCVG